MATARLISRDFFTSGDLEDLGAKAKLLFAGLVVFADDAGVIRHQPRFYRNTILHGERASLVWIETTLSTLCERSVLTPCKLEGVSCYRITNFSRFQRLKRREGKRREDEVEGEGEAVAHEAGEFPAKGQPQSEPPDLKPLTNSQRDVVEFYVTEFCLNPQVALDTVRRLKVEASDLEGWTAALKDAKTKGLRDYRVFLRSRATRFRTAEEAFGVSRSDQWKTFDWEKLLNGGAK